MDSEIYGTIYHITNLQNGKVYIGQTIHSYHERCKAHIYACRGHYHRNDYLQRAVDKYGMESFITGSLCVAYSKEELDGWEDQYIEYYQSMNRDKGYNLKGASSRGRMSAASKRKLSESKKGKNVIDEETRQEINKKLRGRQLSKEHRENIRTAQLGTCRSLETRKKMSDVRKGIIYSQETKEKMSKAKKGKVLSKEHRKNIANARTGKTSGMCGKKHSLEARQKCSDSMKRFHAEKNSKADPSFK